MEKFSVFGKSSGNLKIDRKPWKNDFELISSKNIFRRIVGKLSVNIWNIFVFFHGNASRFSQNLFLNFLPPFSNWTGPFSVGMILLISLTPC